MSQRTHLYRLFISLLFLFGGQQLLSFPKDSTYNLKQVGQQLKGLLQEDLYRKRADFTEEQLTAAVMAELKLPISEISSREDSLLLALVWHKIGVGYKNKLEDYPQAINYYRKALTIRRGLLEPGERDLILGWRNIGNCYVELAQQGFLSYQDSAEWYLFQAIEQDQARQLTGQTAVSLGNLYEWAEDFPKAAEQYELAAANLEQDPYYQAVAQNYWAAALTHTDRPQEALPIALEAKRVFEEMGDVWGQGNVALHLGWIYGKLGQSAASQQAYQAAENWYPADDTSSLQRLYANWGASLYDLDQPLSATQQLQKGLALQPGKQQRSFLYHNLGEAYRANQDFAEAFTAYRRAIQCFPPAESALDLSPRLIENYARLGQTHWEWYQQAFQGVHQLLESHAFFHQTDSLLELISSQPQSRQSKRLRAAQTKAWYESWLQVCLALYRQTQEPSWLEQAFQCAEKSKSNELREHLQSQTILQSMVGEETYRKWQSLEAELIQLSSWKEKYADEPAFADSKLDLLDSLQRLQLQHRLMRAEMEVLNPAFSTLQSSHTTLQIAEIQQRVLAPDQCLVEYFEGQDSLFAFWLTEDTMQVAVIAKPENIETQLYQLLDLMESHADQLVQNPDGGTRFTQEFQAQMAPLSALLLPTLPSPGQMNRLLIVADGMLEQFPFSAMLTEPSLRPTSFRELPFLIRKTAVSQAFSCGIQSLYQTNEVQPRTSFLGMAPIEFSRFQGPPMGLRPLPGSQVELDSLSRQVAGDFHYFSDASQRAFFYEGASAAILHLSTHGVVDSLHPEMSFLSLFDGPIYAYDLYHRQFQAHLVVNSLCEGNRGKVDPGEGVRSLTRAFAYTGAKSVLSTQWSLLDTYTTPFMQAFYEAILAGKTKDEALQQAQLTLLDAGLSHPLFWAPYVMYGDVEALPEDLREELIPTSSMPGKWLILGIFLLLVVGGIMAVRAKRLG
ncbi:MAG: CHAT domain-containing protein [Bacteroidota bacterium]